MTQHCVSCGLARRDPGGFCAGCGRPFPRLTSLLAPGPKGRRRAAPSAPAPSPSLDAATARTAGALDGAERPGRCTRCGTAIEPPWRRCRACSIELSAAGTAAGRREEGTALPPPGIPAAPSTPARRSPVAGSREIASPWWTAAPRAQRVRIGLGLAGILVIAAYLAVDAGGLEPPRPSDTAPGAPSGWVGRQPGAPAGEAQTPLAAPVGSVAPTTPSAGGPSTPLPVPPATAPPPPAPPPPAPPPPAPETTPTPAATPTPLPTTVVLEGSGSLTTHPFAHPGGRVQVRSLVTAGAAGCYYIGTFSATAPALLPADASLRTAVLFLEGAGSAEGWVDLELSPGSYFMEIDSDCDWTVTVAPA